MKIVKIVLRSLFIGLGVAIIIIADRVFSEDRLGDEI